jgi:hypothetical protein
MRTKMAAASFSNRVSPGIVRFFPLLCLLFLAASVSSAQQIVGSISTGRLSAVPERS